MSLVSLLLSLRFSCPSCMSVHAAASADQQITGPGARCSLSYAGCPACVSVWAREAFCFRFLLDGQDAAGTVSLTYLNSNTPSCILAWVGQARPGRGSSTGLVPPYVLVEVYQPGSPTQHKTQAGDQIEAGRTGLPDSG